MDRDRPGLMTLRDLALLLALALAAPAAILLLRGVRGDGEPARERPRRGLETLWAVAPIALLVALVALSAVAS